MEVEVEGMFWFEDCSWNFVQVFEGEGLDGPSRGKWCDNVVPLPITSNGNALTVHLFSNYDFLGHFAFTYSVLNSGKRYGCTFLFSLFIARRTPYLPVENLLDTSSIGNDLL